MYDERASAEAIRKDQATRKDLNLRYMNSVTEVLKATPAKIRRGLFRQDLPGGVPHRFIGWPQIGPQCVTVTFQVLDEHFNTVAGLGKRFAYRAGSQFARVYRDLSVVRAEFTLPEGQWLEVPWRMLPHARAVESASGDQLSGHGAPVGPCVGLRSLGTVARLDWTVPHKKVFGGTQTGKTTLLVCVGLSTVKIYQPEECRLVILNPKNEPDLAAFNGVPHMAAPVGWTVDECATLLRFVLGEMLMRETDRDRARARLVVIIDETADLTLAREDIGVMITRLSQKAGGLGINLIAASQSANPLVFGKTGSLARANFGSSIVFQLPFEQSYLATGLAGVHTEQLGRGGDGLGVVNASLTRFRSARADRADLDALPRTGSIPAMPEIDDLPEDLDAGGGKGVLKTTYAPDIVGDMLAYAIEMRDSSRALMTQFGGAQDRASWIRDMASQFRKRAEYWRAVREGSTPAPLTGTEYWRALREGSANI